jgi:hypothetical protein
MDQDTFVRTSAVAIGATTLFFAGWALVRPHSLAAKMRVTPRHAHLLGYRDLASGLLLLADPSPAAFAFRAAADAMDATTLASRRPGIAAGAAMFGAWSVLAGTMAARNGPLSPRSLPTMAARRGDHRDAHEPAGWDVW